MKPVHLDGRSLTRAQVLAVAYGAPVELDEAQLPVVARAADFLAEQVSREEPIYGVSTGFGSNADRRSARTGAQRCGQRRQQSARIPACRAAAQSDRHPCGLRRRCVRAGSRARDALHPHQYADARPLGIRVETLRALAAMLNAASSRSCRSWVRSARAAISRRCRTSPSCCSAAAKAFLGGERLDGAEALRRAGLAPVTLSYKEGLALNNGTAQMLATGVLALAKLEDLVDTADLAAAMTIDAFAGRLGAFKPEVHALRPHPGQVHVAAHLLQLLQGSTLADIPITSCRASARGCPIAGPPTRRASCASTSAGTGCRCRSATVARSSTSASVRSAAARSTSRRQLFAAVRSAGARCRA